jgi:hypothetical protein
MWDQYKKTLWGLQVVIGVIAGAVLVLSHSLGAAAFFFATMQVAAVVGAMWGIRLKDKVTRKTLRATSRG